MYRRHPLVAGIVLGYALLFSSTAESQVLPSWAQTGGTQSDVSNGIIHSMQADQTVGTLEGRAGVSGGAAVYSIPIAVAPGRNGMQPSVSLNYSSRTGSALAGVGWSLQASSAISRCSATRAQDGFNRAVIMSTADKLCLDGQKLIAVSGSYGLSGTLYRTEDDQFARVTQVGALSSASVYFTVAYKDNTVATYGGTTDSRHIAQGHTLPHSWAISRQQDRAANAIDYAYQHIGSGEYVLSTIFYTGYQSTLGDRKVVFQYETRPDPARRYLAGGLIRSTRRLLAIESQVGSTQVRRYTLGYDQSAHTNRSLLATVTECSNSVCKTPTQFRSYTPLLAFDNFDSSSTANRVMSPVSGNGRNDRTLRNDLNGDGVHELIYLSSQYNTLNQLTGYSVQIYQRQSNGDYTLQYDASSQPGGIANGIYYYPQGDLNGDGITDFFIVNPSNGQLSLLQFNQQLVPQPLLATNVYLPSAFYTNPSGVGATLQILDINGDGHQDFAYVGTDNKLYYYQNQGGATPHFTGPLLLATLNTFTYLGRSYREQVQFKDVDGDGVVDVLKTWQSATTTTQINVQFGALSGSNYSLGPNVTSASLGLPTNHFNNEYVFADINGDGLEDYVRAVQTSGVFSWQVRENRGNRTFDTERTLGTGTGIHLYHFTNMAGTNSSRVQSRWGGLRVADTDSDGRDELVVATHSLDNVCVEFSGSPNSSGDVEPYSVSVCNDNLHNEYASVYSHPGQNIRIDWATYDTRRFYWTVLDFKDSSTGATIDREIPNVVYAPISSFVVQSGERSVALQLSDIDNNGFVDFSYNVMTNYLQRASHNQQLMVGGQPYYNAFLSLSYKSGSPAYASGYFEQYNQAGEAADSGKLVDTVYEVEDGLGALQRWDYAPLSRILTGRIGNTPFYQVPLNRYIDNDPTRSHFYFTSSMYVVSDSYRDNGIGGMARQQFHYKEAIYNREGRGFQGFRRIITDDMESGLRTVNTFHQRFPLAGKLETSRVCLSSDTLSFCEQSPLNLEQYDYHALATTSAGTWWVYPTLSLQQQFALDNRSTMMQEVKSTVGTSTADVDMFGNILYRTTERFNGFMRVQHTEQRQFDVDSANWWLNKLSSDTRSQQTLWRDTTTAAGITTGADDSSSTTTTYAYTGNGLTYRLPTQTVQTASGSTQSLTTHLVYNSHGLPSSTTHTGQGVSGSGTDYARAVSISYSPDGYFPRTVTNDKGHSTTSVLSSLHGQPLSTTDANGVSASMTYDGFGRLASQSVPGGKTQYLGLRRCTSGCNVGEVYNAFVSQEGSALQLRYFDKLQRPVRETLQGFGGTTVYKRWQYNAQGQLAFEAIPSYSATESKGTRYITYDALGRVLEKEQDITAQRTLFTEYTYNSFTTYIDVNDGQSLSMSRTYGGDGMLISTTDAEGGITRYAYNNQGLPITLRDAAGNAIYAFYNGFGHKTRVNDPNMGQKLFSYNTFGEIEQEQDANGNTLRYRYDGLGRLEQRTLNGSIHSTLSYDVGPYALGKLSSESAGTYAKSYAYDSLGRLYAEQTQIDGINYWQEMQYDSHYGRLTSRQYPGGLTVGYRYDAYGYQTQTVNAASGFVYQHITARDARFNATEALKNGSTLTETRHYDVISGQLEQITAQSGSYRVHDLAYTYGSFGNLDTQTVRYDNGIKFSIEAFTYDNLHRLKSSVRSFNGITYSEPPLYYDYTATGNLTKKSDYASVLYYGNSSRNAGGNAGPNAVRSITRATGGSVSYSYDNNGNMLQGDGKTLTYNAFNLPVTVSGGGHSSTFSYGADLQRYKQVLSNSSGTETLHYIGKTAEVSIKGSTTTTRLFIDDIAIISKTQVSGQSTATYAIRYTLRDRLGSVVSLTNEANTLSEHRSYDPFGKPRKGDYRQWSPATLTGVVGTTPFTSRGFTDHEHLDGAQLIHMNGRVYDYNIGRFYSVDPVIQAPGNSQSLNPYSYIMNNPLAGTDPTGYVADCLLSIHCGEMQGQIKGPFNYPNNCRFCVSAGGSGQSGDNGKEQQAQKAAQQHEAITEIGSQSKAQGPGGSGVNVAAGGVMDPNTIFDDVTIMGDWKKSGKVKVSVTDDGTFLDINLTVARDEGVDSKAFDIAIREIKDIWNNQYKSEQGVLTIRTNITAIDDPKKADFTFKNCELGIGCSVSNPAHVNIGSPSQNIIHWSRTASAITVYPLNRNPIASHEFGHMLGLWHQKDGSGSLMSYDENRKKSGLLEGDARKLVEAYR